MKKLEMDRLPFIDSVAPKLRPQKIDESYKDYRDYLIIEVRDALLGANVEVPYQIEFNTSPLWQLKLLLEEDINVESITNIEMFIHTMKTIRLGMGQMKDIDERINFHKFKKYKIIHVLTLHTLKHSHLEQSRHLFCRLSVYDVFS